MQPSVPSTSPIQGIYEVCIGTRTPIPLIQYWEQFGYRISQVGELPASTVQKLYGINSSLYSIRLYHQEADHGLIRLMVWETPINDGLRMASMKVKGNRWATTLTANLLHILNHVEEAVAANWPIRYTFPQWEVIYHKEHRGRPFIDPAVGVREMLLLQLLTRQVLFERFNYTLPHYGQINQSAIFKASQITHMGIVIQDDSKETLQFYEDVLQLLRVRDDVETTYESSKAAQKLFDLQPNEQFFVTAFDDPRSSKTDLQAVRSGRLYIVRFPEAMQLANHSYESQPGCLGMSLYTYRVREIEEYWNRVQASQARNLTEIVSNEFGEPSFSFIAPDGYAWTLIAV